MSGDLSQRDKTRNILFFAGIVGVISAVLVGFIALKPHKEETRAQGVQSGLPWQAQTISDGIEDDGRGTVLIHGAYGYHKVELNLNSLLARKAEWQKRFPTKHIVSAAHIAFDGGGNTEIQNLLIFYEER